MTHIGKNIKKIRTVKKLSQASFAELFSLARPSVGAYEEGRAEPKLDTIIQIAQHFGLSIDLLINKELTVNDLYKFDLMVDDISHEERMKLAKDDEVLSGGIGLVMEAKYLEYIVNYQNKDFISNLVKIHLPIKDQDSSRAFQLNGSEMEFNHNGLHHGDILLGKLVPEKNYEKLNQGKVYIIITKQNIITRRFYQLDKRLVFKADDPNYEDLQLNKTEILELWEVYGVFSTYLNPPSTLETRILQIENDLKELKGQIR